MIVILDETVREGSEEFRRVLSQLEFEGVSTEVHVVHGRQRQLIEIYLIGSTAGLDQSQIEAIEGVERVLRISEAYRRIGRHADTDREHGFSYRGVTFSQDEFIPCLGLCAVDNEQNVNLVMKAVSGLGLVCTRMGAYKPRTSPYDFQGHGQRCLRYVFEAAGRHGIQIVAMEVTSERHVDEIRKSLEETGNPCGVILQIGTRNTQNFELLKSVGSQTDFPILLKRGFGISLDETLNATEYLAMAGNARIILCLRGVKTHFAAPHRNLVEFAHVPVVRRLTRLPVCIDPSHSVGIRAAGPEGIPDVWHAAAQGVIAGANMVLADVHPDPRRALVDGAQAITLEELPTFHADLRICRDAYERRCKLVSRSAG